jgi:nucleoside-diphosphate-sugar epimerase
VPAGIDEAVRAPRLDHGTDWQYALRGIDSVVHLAARVHVLRDRAAIPRNEFRRVNVLGTLSLARQASQAGVRRFVFVSSIKVNGESTVHGHRFSADDVPAPSDAYGASKREAEDGLRTLARETGLEVVIIRPVLTYGPGVKGNFLQLLGWVYKGLPLPFGRVRNCRSFVGVRNLAHFIIACLDFPGELNDTFLVSDGEDLSTPELLRRTARAFGVQENLWDIPVALLSASSKLIGRSDAVGRLLGSLQVDSTKARHRLNWLPPFSVDEELRETAKWYGSGHSR